MAVRYHRGMTKPTQEVSDSDSPSAPQPASSTSSTSWRWVALAALLIAVVATVIAVWALVRPPQPAGAAAAGTEMTAEEAQTSLCDAFAVVRGAVSLRTNANLGSEPVALETIAANAHLAMDAGGTFLLDRINPATPPELAHEVRSFALNLQEIAIYALAGVPNSDAAQAGRLSAGVETDNRIAELCA